MMNRLPGSRCALRFLAAALAVAVCAAAVTGCAPIVVAAGVGAGTLVATDRRTTGAQVDDESIELKVATTTNDRWSTGVHLNATSYNGNVLLTGEAPTQAVKDEIAQMAGTTDRVRNVANEMVVGPESSFGARSNDTYITSKVKSRFVEANKFAATHVKVVTERGIVYLMGIVSRQEGDDAAQLAASTSDVVRVVKVFEYTN
jgi:osmotically-inducible protein OsmY